MSRLESIVSSLFAMFAVWVIFSLGASAVVAIVDGCDERDTYPIGNVLMTDAFCPRKESK